MAYTAYSPVTTSVVLLQIAVTFICGVQMYTVELKQVYLEIRLRMLINIRQDLFIRMIHQVIDLIQSFKFHQS